jgi:flagellin-like protein
MHVNDPNPDGRNRAVSPVIGVILMVAITVILAAVIGAFVLEIGDQQETAPSTSFDSEQFMEFHSSASGHKANITVAEISHAGGNNIDVMNLEAKFRGNSSLWGIAKRTDGSSANFDPTPDYQAALGTNEQVTITSGETLRFTHFNGINDEYVGNCQYKAGIYMGNGEPGARIENDCENDGPDGNTDYTSNAAPHPDNVRTNKGAPPIGYPGDPATGEAINVVWEASSGGKTQNLFKYTIQ